MSIVSLDYCIVAYLQESLSSEQKETALHKLPSLLEISGQVYFFGGFLVGPLVSICLVLI